MINLGVEGSVVIRFRHDYTVVKQTRDGVGAAHQWTLEEFFQLGRIHHSAPRFTIAVLKPHHPDIFCRLNAAHQEVWAMSRCKQSSTSLHGKRSKMLAELSRQRRMQKCLRLINKNCVELARHHCGNYAREGLNAIAGVLDVGGLLVETPRAFIQ